MHADNAAALDRRICRVIGGLLALTIMLAIKGHYSAATADQLTWMLAPTARLTAWLTCAHPIWEAGTGYVDFGQGIIIAPGCAGINFMIMAFGLAALCGLPRIDRLVPLLAWLVLSLASAYGLALAVNAVRIAVSMHLYHAGIHWAWFTVERVHRLAGVAIYLGALGLFFKVLAPIIECCSNRSDLRDRPDGSALPPWLPVAWYMLGAVGVPSANLLFRDPATGFGEHCVTVIVAGLALYGGGRLIRWSSGRFSPQCCIKKRRFDIPYEQSTDCGG
jgi:exosortase K